ncbi:nucleotidyl transferase AbiEii/AbiGii toxin family protein [Nemorincola caseinilytica]|uniref:Nucleotidyl transferase AbiEii/AbiGii toxin family protein n=1 Tax=Nemorincola caseinilytica TaxID=2054315 RepID=A0ABP8NKH2_9BACT
MILAQDLADFIELLNRHKVRYMVVGGYALAFHGKPRYTGDIDIWIEISEKNAAKLLRVIRDFGMTALGFVKEDFLKEGYISQIGMPPLRIDILNSIDGVAFAEAYERAEVVEMDHIKIYYISLRDFIKNKEATGRKKDLADIKEIKGAAAGKKKRGK